MQRVAKSWTTLNPEYVYHLFDQTGQDTTFPAKEYGASKADLWRYLIMFQYGGVYADLDMPATIKNREQKVPQKVVSICHSVGYLSPGIGPDRRRRPILVPAVQ
jgi:hypothetical protein